MALDSGMLDSHTHLRVNTQAKDRVNFRKKVTYSPVNADDLITSTIGDSIVIIELQKLLNSEGWAWPFNRAYTDLSLCLISQNSVAYPKPVYNPLFWANGSSIHRDIDEDIQYFGNNYFNTLACLEQIQLCNPRAGKYTNTTDTSTALWEAGDLELNIQQRIMLHHIAILLGLINIASLGPVF
ncbi:unnamed protein product [Fusarium venenatum]|uniref:Uncharacterized protein n=1 Tax=Fusarium venenatum TaxID=56646 RepID=A0A2L2TZK0_9HYPO|nr:uncharacterized protein FVRRES_07927 [Fusarium venenatum]CEI67850.1 unnamed protein product [Fusarium venenatum]